MANFYLIAVDKDKDTTALHNFIDSSPMFINWWHYISSAYIVKTNDNLAGVQAALQRNWPNNRYLLIKVDPTYRDGWLNPEAYQWFRDNAN